MQGRLQFPARGFTLLEVMVVVALMVLVTAVAVPALLNGSDRDRLEDQRERIVALFEQLSERSLFRTQLLAVRLTPSSIQPLQYSYQQQEFVPIGGPFSTLQLPDELRLSWQLNQTSTGDTSMREAMKARLSELARKRASSDASPTESRSQPPPQIFFYPSGGATPVTLWLRTVGESLHKVRIRLTSLGRIEDNGDEQQDAG